MLLLLTAACGAREASRLETVNAPDIVVRSEKVLDVNDSTTVWYTLERPATSSIGSPCTERGLEIRTPGRRQLVPLLYTLDIPTIVSDTTIRVAIYRNCVPERRYLVDLRSGQPTPEPQEER